MTRLRITEIFYSLQGEGRTVGRPTVFVRLTGCPLRCAYCDTEYAFSGGEWLELSEILQRVAAYNPNHICVTGGEPLAQKACLELLTALCDAGYEVSLETCGALDISSVDARVSRVMDIKTPGSGEAERNLPRNIDCLTAQDQLKFVICNEADYAWSCGQLAEQDLAAKCEVLFSPTHGGMDATQLAEWILRDNLPVRFQLQLHKLLWGDQPGK
ncbi:MAG: 7-carboxy-7-deazaguanine synthase QueE [Pseudomonadota bacterium]